MKTTKKGQILINFHMHSTGSDGKMAPEEVVKEAIAAGIRYMCFTDHYFLPLGFDYNQGYFSSEYVKTIRGLQKKYKEKIDISFGAEFDWVEKNRDWIKKEIEKNKFDYVIGSVHDIFKDGKDFEVSCDRGEEGKKKWLEDIRSCWSVKELVEEYFRQVNLIADSGLFDSIGHIDIIKLYNRNSDLFDENSDWYKNQISSALDAVKRANMALEINLRGLVKYPQAQYPSIPVCGY